MNIWDVVMVAACQGGAAVVPEVLGNELHAQPGFDASTGMTLNGWSIGSSQANSNGNIGFLTCTAAETLDTGDYRITIDVASNGGSGDILVNIGGTPKIFGGVEGAAGVHTARVTAASISNQNLLIRDSDEVGIVLNGISIKKVVSG